MRSLVTAVLAAVLLAPLAVAAEDGAAVAAAAERQRYVLEVEGMTCPTGCAPKVHDSLASIEGVRSVEVDFENKRAVVVTDPGVELTSEACDRSFQNQGYFVSSLSKQAAAQ